MSDSETSTCRQRLGRFCQGNGLDIGAGGDAINPRAICLDRDPSSRKDHGQSPTHLIGDAANLRWFRNDSLDYVYSSHCLEDFVDTAGVLKEWLRVIRPGGLLVLFLPDQPTYAAYCRSVGVEPNGAHKHAQFSLSWLKRIFGSIGIGQVVHELWPVPGNSYSFDLVVKKP